MSRSSALACRPASCSTPSAGSGNDGTKRIRCRKPPVGSNGDCAGLASVGARRSSARPALAGRARAAGPRPGRRGEQQTREATWSPVEPGEMKIADSGAAGEAMAEMRTDRAQLRRARGPECERLHDRGEPLAFLAGLDPLEAAMNRRRPFGDRPVGFRVRPAVALADLLIREAVRLHHQRLGLVGLQRSQRLGRSPHPLIRRDLLLDAALDARNERVEVEILVGDGLARARRIAIASWRTTTFSHATSVAGSTVSTRRTKISSARW